MATNGDLVGLVEAGYRLDLDDAAWLGNVAQHARCILDSGPGIVGSVFFDSRDSNRFRWNRLQVSGAGKPIEMLLKRALSVLPADWIASIFGGTEALATVSSSLEMGPQKFARHPLTATFGHPLGFHDVLTFKVTEPTGLGAMIALPRSKIEEVSRRDAHTFALCAAHIGAALRIRRAIGTSENRDVEAVLLPDGKCMHAEEPASPKAMRELLRAAVLQQERARGRLRRLDPDEALNIWEALVVGRWSLVERFESDGRRILVARRNDPSVPDPRGLTLRERQVVAYVALGHSGKLVAYELGLTRAAVSQHLRSAKAKLGARTLSELLAIVRGAPGERPAVQS